MKSEQIAASTLHLRATPACSECGSSDVRCEAFASWNERLQDWRVSELIETNQVCNRCGKDCNVNWRIKN
jgi:hypothetical protein